jgi:MFS transporter, PPP family, 3-phenylpropionic acid transporter
MYDSTEASQMKKAIPFTFNFVYFVSFAAVGPFIVLYYQQLGFNGAEISLLAGLPPLVTLFASPFWTNLADNTQRHKLIMSLGLAMVAVTLTALPFLSTFATVMLCVLVFNVFVAPLSSLSDSATMSMLGDEKDQYGRIRLGGTIGWGLGAPIVGALIKQYGLNMAFWSGALMTVLGLIVSQGLSFSKREESKPQGSVRDLLVNRRWIIFLALAFLGGISFASTSAYFAPYMKELGGNEFHTGIALTVSTLTELPIFFFGDRLLKRFKPYGLLVFALIITSLRSLLFAAAGTPLLAILAQLLNGFTFPAVWVAGVAYADENAPAGLKSTAQGLFGAMTFGFGSAVGGFMGGFLLESIGGRALYLVYGAVILVGVTLITLIEKRFTASVEEAQNPSL